MKKTTPVKRKEKSSAKKTNAKLSKPKLASKKSSAKKTNAKLSKPKLASKKSSAKKTNAKLSKPKLASKKSSAKKTNIPSQKSNKTKNSHVLIQNRFKQSTANNKNNTTPFGDYTDARNQMIDSNHKLLKEKGIVFHYDRSEKSKYHQNIPIPSPLSRFIRLSFALCLFIAITTWLFLKIFQ